MAKIAHKFETQSTPQTEPPIKQIPQTEKPVRQNQFLPAKSAVIPEPVIRESPVISPVPEPARSPSPPPTVVPPVPAQTQQHIAQSLERWNDDLAEAVEEVDDGAWREQVDEQDDAWKDEEEIGYVQENSNLETVAEETGSGLIAVALYDYQAAAEDELSFDPDEVIANIEMVMLINL
jgi:cortactin